MTGTVSIARRVLLLLLVLVVSGPAVLEVWTTDGRRLKRYEREQVPVNLFEPPQQRPTSEPSR